MRIILIVAITALLAACAGPGGYVVTRNGAHIDVAHFDGPNSSLPRRETSSSGDN